MKMSLDKSEIYLKNNFELKILDKRKYGLKMFLSKTFLGNRGNLRQIQLF